jgi:hypothetical protein
LHISFSLKSFFAVCSFVEHPPALSAIEQPRARNLIAVVVPILIRSRLVSVRQRVDHMATALSSWRLG